jgi:hypothetical protein
MAYFRTRYFGARYWDARYWGRTTVPVVPPRRIALKDVGLVDIGTPYDLRIATFEHTFRKKISTVSLVQDLATLESSLDLSYGSLESINTRLHRLEINLKQLEADRRQMALDNSP